MLSKTSGPSCACTICKSRSWLGTGIVNLRQRSVVKVINSQKSGAIGPVAWSPDGKRIAIAGGSGVELLDAISGEIIFHEELEEAAHMNVRFTSDNRYFIECDENGRGTGLGVKIWDYHHERLLQEMSGNIGSIAVTRDGKYLAVGRALIGSGPMAATKKGKVVENFHYVGDLIWEVIKPKGPPAPSSS